MGKANAQLIMNGEFAILDPPSFGAISPVPLLGAFSHKTWKVNLDLAKMVAHPSPRRSEI